MDGRKAVESYKEQYFGMYGHNPPERRVESFCRMYGIECPLPRDHEELEQVRESFWREMNEGGSKYDG